MFTFTAGIIVGVIVGSLVGVLLNIGKREALNRIVGAYRGITDDRTGRITTLKPDELKKQEIKDQEEKWYGRF